MTKNPNCDPLIYLYLGCCYFFLGLYEEADKAAQKGKFKDFSNKNYWITIVNFLYVII